MFLKVANGTKDILLTCMTIHITDISLLMFPNIFYYLTHYPYIDSVHNNPMKKTKANLFLKHFSTEKYLSII